MAEREVPIPITVDGQLKFFDGGLSDEQVRELFADATLKANAKGLFVETPEQAGARQADDTRCRQCGNRCYADLCTSCQADLNGAGR